MLEFIGTCVGLRAGDLDNFDDSSRTVNYRTFRKHVGMTIIKELNSNFGVPLHKDWAVSFAIGKWRGKKAICLFHSSIHHLWYLPKKDVDVL